MKFEDRDLDTSVGWSLAHSVSTPTNRWPKGLLLTESLITEITTAGVKTAQVYLLEENDIDEDAAAMWVAEKIAGAGLACVAAGKGRANLISSMDGLFLPGPAIDALNQLDDAFSAASLAAYSVVTKNQLVATIKLVPYGINRSILTKFKPLEEKVRISAFTPFNVSLIYTGPQPTAKTLKTLSRRVGQLGGSVENVVETDHTIPSLTTALQAQAQKPASIIMLLGASAISDVRDVLPSALIASGGTIIKLGMPTDPGNLLMLGDLNGTPVIGMPGCARSPALNGFDWILERLAAAVPLDHNAITGMGVGGLLKEHAGRTVPRYSALPPDVGAGGFAVLLLAAGKASRAKGINKLLATIGTTTVVEQALNRAAETQPDHLITVTGHASGQISSALKDIQHTLIENSDFENGMGSSLACGIKALPDDTHFCMICLGDMPFIQPATYAQLKKAAQTSEPGSIIIPTFHGKRGHPVVWHNQFFAELGQLSGDIGGKAVLEANRDRIIEIAVEDPGILIDLDTPEMLAHFGVIPTDQQ